MAKQAVQLTHVRSDRAGDSHPRSDRWRNVPFLAINHETGSKKKFFSIFGNRTPIPIPEGNYRQRIENHRYISVGQPIKVQPGKTLMRDPQGQLWIANSHDPVTDREKFRVYLLERAREAISLAP